MDERTIYCANEGCEAEATNVVVDSISGRHHIPLCFGCATVYEWGYEAGGGNGESTVPIDEYEPDFFTCSDSSQIERMFILSVGMPEDDGSVRVVMQAPVEVSEIIVPADDAETFMEWYYV